MSGLTPLDKTLWALKKSLVGNKQKEFMWKLAHNGLKMGSFWEGRPGREHWVNCPSFGGPESAEHTLTECPNSGQKVIWGLVNRLVGCRLTLRAAEFLGHMPWGGGAARGHQI